jgi:hypothetical protein
MNFSDFYFNFCFQIKVNCSSSIIEKLYNYFEENNLNTLANMMLNGEIEGGSIEFNSDKMNDYKDNLFSFYCTKIFKDSYSTFKSQTFVNQMNDKRDLNQDLFIEQALLCGLVGNKIFLNFRFANLIMSFQQNDGCFSL